MKSMKKFGIFIITIVGLQGVVIQALEQSEKSVVQDGTIMSDASNIFNERLKDYLNLYEGFDLIKENYKDVTSFEDFMKMQGAYTTEDAFIQAINKSKELIASHMKNKFLFELTYAMKYHKSLETITDPQFVYVMKYRDGFMAPIIKNWINEIDEFGNTMIYKAVLYNNIEIVKFLLACQADLNIKDMVSANPLCLAVRNNNKDLVKILINAHANLNVQDGYEQTPLHFATQKNFIDIVDLLIQAKADLNIQDEFGRTPLRVAVQHNNLAVVKMLLNAGADVSTINSTKDSAEQLAMSPEMMALLEEYHAHQPSDETKSM